MVISIFSCKKEETEINYTDYVNVFIGTGGHGHTFPGPTLPHGMVQLSPDTRLEGWDACAGYYYEDSVIHGFTHTHLNGTGRGDYGDILFMPTKGDSELTMKQYCSTFSHDNEYAFPGYYQVLLDKYSINVELELVPLPIKYRFLTVILADLAVLRPLPITLNAEQLSTYSKLTLSVYVSLSVTKVLLLLYLPIKLISYPVSIVVPILYLPSIRIDTPAQFTDASKALFIKRELCPRI